MKKIAEEAFSTGIQERKLVQAKTTLLKCSRPNTTTISIDVNGKTMMKNGVIA